MPDVVCNGSKRYTDYREKNRLSHFSFLFPFPYDTQGLILAAALSEYKKAVATL